MTRRTTTHRVIERLSSPWLLLLPFPVYLAIALACTAPTGPGSFDDSLDPAKLEQVGQVQQAISGTWLYEATFRGRDDVDRPLRAGHAVWEVEIFDIDPVSNSVDDARYRWRGVVRPVSLCLVNSEDFVPGSAEESCDEFATPQLGRCTGHSCEQYGEREVDGFFDLDEDSFGMNRGNFDLYTVDPLTGYINLDFAGHYDSFLGQTARPWECSHGTNCQWDTTTAGLYEGEYPEVTGSVHEVTFSKVSEVVLHKSDDEIDEAPAEFVIGAKNATEEVLLGQWQARMQFESRDDVDRPISVGHADYLLEIFEIEEAPIVGLWNWKGAISPASVCVVSAEEADNGTYRCDVFGPTQMGRCSGADCSDDGEIAVDGQYNDLDGRFTVHRSSGDTFFLDAARGYIFVDCEFRVEEATLIGQTVESTRVQQSFGWNIRTSGTFEDSHPGDWSSSEQYFEMSR